MIKRYVLPFFVIVLGAAVVATPHAGLNKEPPLPQSLNKPSNNLADMVMKSLKGDQPSAPPTASAPLLSNPLPVPLITQEGISKARFRFLDKTFAKVFTRTLNVNSRYRWGPLEIQLLRCHKAAPREGGDSFVFVEVYDTTPTLMPTLIFKGWMSALYPSVSGVDHPLYDVWLEGCE